MDPIPEAIYQIFRNLTHTDLFLSEYSGLNIGKWRLVALHFPIAELRLIHQLGETCSNSFRVDVHPMCFLSIKFVSQYIRARSLTIVSGSANLS